MGKPINTSYLLVTEDKDFQDCADLAEERGISFEKLSYPTIMAKRDDKIIGFISTWPRDKHIIAGPLAVKLGHAFSMVRLVEAYDNFIRANGVESYYFTVQATNKNWLKMIHRATGLVAFQSVNGILWFERRLKH